MGLPAPTTHSPASMGWGRPVFYFPVFKGFLLHLLKMYLHFLDC